MTDSETVILVLQILTLLSTTLSPLILALSLCIKNIKRSNCLGSSLEMKNNVESPVEETPIITRPIDIQKTKNKNKTHKSPKNNDLYEV